MVIQRVKLDDIESYKGDNKKSFEHLCYQIVSEEYKEEISKWAKLTPVDDSWWWAWVEFYIEFSNWDIWGWQCKYINRVSEWKEQIKKSLHKSYSEYWDKLKKWTLCSKNDLTPTSTNKTGTTIKWEYDWYHTELQSTKILKKDILPVNHWIDLVHWWDSEINKFLAKYPKINNYFFAVKNHEFEWFENRYKLDSQRSEVKVKYQREIHIPTEIDEILNKTLVNEELIDILENEMSEQQVEVYEKEYIDACNLNLTRDVDDEFKAIQDKSRELLNWKLDIINKWIEYLNEFKVLIKENKEEELRSKLKDFNNYIEELKKFRSDFNSFSNSDFCSKIDYCKFPERIIKNDIHIDKKDNILSKLFVKLWKLLKISVWTDKWDDNFDNIKYEKEINSIQQKNREIWKIRDVIFWALSSLNEYSIQSLENCVRVFDLIDQNEFHIAWDAWMWKTHVSFNIYENYIINKKQPAILIFAKDLNTESTLEDQIKVNLKTDDLDSFLSKLEFYANQNNIKIPLIIDWLNESKYWSTIWKHDLEKLIINIKENFKHIIIITTYRTSYEKEIFPDNYFDYKYDSKSWMKKTNIFWFDRLQWDAIEEYFKYYKISLINHTDAIWEFRHPLYLKLFCEIKNKDRAVVKKVSFKNEDLFQVFDEYIKQANKNITNNLKSLKGKYNSNFTMNKLLKMSSYIWRYNTRWIPCSLNLFKDEELEIFEWENLLVYKDWNKEWNIEEIQFTYDLLWGYIISISLIDQFKNGYPFLNFQSDNNILTVIKAFSDKIITERWTNFIWKKLFLLNDYIWKKNWLSKFVKSSDFKKKLLEDTSLHPLYSDILRSLCILLIKEEKLFLFNILKNDRAIKYSVDSIFEINKDYIIENQKLVEDYLRNYFTYNLDKLLIYYKRFKFDTFHPLNFYFFHTILFNCSLPVRDSFWTEHISYYKYESSIRLLKWFADNYKQILKFKDGDEKLFLIWIFFSWFLASTNNYIRNKVTKLLVQYFTDKPKSFVKIFEEFLNVNDPYIFQRLLAISWGIVSRSDKNDNIKGFINYLYKYFYIDQNIPIDILSRDYLKLIVEYWVKKLWMNLDLNITEYPYNSEFNENIIPGKDNLKKISDKLYSWNDKYHDIIWNSVMYNWLWVDDFWKNELSSKVSSWSNVKLSEPKIPTQEDVENNFFESLSTQQLSDFKKIEKSEESESLTIRLKFLIDSKTNKTSNDDKWIEKDYVKEKKLFLKKLNVDQLRYYYIYDDMVKRNWMFERLNSFDKELAERYVYNRVLELWYNKELHSEFDRIVWRWYDRWEKWKTERIWKKYQWIALYELLARISDNYKFFSEQDYWKEWKFISAQTTYIRDIDPTHIAKSKLVWSYDEELDNYLYSTITNKDFIKNESNLEDKKWIESNEGIPEYKQLIERVDDKGKIWVVLEWYFSITEKSETWDSNFDWKKQLRNQMRSYLVKKQDYSEMKEWLKKQNFMWRRLMPESTDNHFSYLWELYWSKWYNNLYTPYYWYDDWTDWGWELPKKVIVTAENYRTERDWDDIEWIWTENYLLLSKFLWDNIKCDWNDKKEAFVNSKWEIIAFNPIIKWVKENSLLIRKDVLITFLNKNNLEILYTILWEKMVLWEKLYNRNTINGVYYFDDKWKISWDYSTIIDNE